MYIYKVSKHTREVFKNISIIGRVAYLICLFERLLLYYKCDKEEWKIVLEKLWSVTTVQYMDEWMYEFAEYLPDSILEDTMDDAEYITESDFNYLNKVYSKTPRDILLFLEIIFDCQSVELYTTIYDDSPGTLEKVEEGINMLKAHNIEIISAEPFRKYSFKESGGWGKSFDGKSLSILL
ncbi:MAG: hypothetical protein J6D02_04905 [Lachnospira sp.]|nr:hypothetical protein [Lachnospira sp.]